MIKELGQVERLDRGGAWIATIQQSTCNACQAKNGCGQKLLNQLGASTSSVWAALATENNLQLKPGDWVEVGIEEGAIVLGSLLAYGLPVILLVLGAVLGEGTWLGSAPSALVGLLSGALFTRRILRDYIRGQFFQPMILALSPMEEERQIHLQPQ